MKAPQMPKTITLTTVFSSQERELAVDELGFITSHVSGMLATMVKFPGNLHVTMEIVEHE